MGLTAAPQARNMSCTNGFRAGRFAPAPEPRAEGTCDESRRPPAGALIVGPALPAPSRHVALAIHSDKDQRKLQARKRARAVRLGAVDYETEKPGSACGLSEPPT
eukprot:CAMPEP_0176310732 /NCGR_PEP_ID=MMETSP0121_2-20121125/65757_1 /TAXON_ID=160619 /ORGANISM="Kryptoperidinium foliaceum, Strain CCMP 1326" /LENGTH=104 /DNA_ID=CAMNT_0017652697 /DNA_START=10 /DNA_END=323 /DNA_ORIENTATION=+